MPEDFVVALKGLTDEQYYEWALVRLLLDDGYPSSEIPFMIESCKLTDMVRNPKTRWAVMHNMGAPTGKK